MAFNTVWVTNIGICQPYGAGDCGQSFILRGTLGKGAELRG